MSDIPAGIAAQMAQTRLNVAMSTIKSNADMQQQVADMLMETIKNVPVSDTRGSNVNFSA